MACEQWIAESLSLPYRSVLGMIFGNYIGGGFAKPNAFSNTLVCNDITVLLCTPDIVE